MFICFYFGEMKKRGEGFKLNGARVFDQRQFFFVWPRPSSRPPTQIVICCQPLEPFSVCLNKTGDPGSSWGAGIRSQAAPNSEMENSSMKTASAVPGARATALNLVSCPHTAPTPARSPGGAPSMGKNQHLQRAEPLSPGLWEGRAEGDSSAAPP